MVAQRVRAGRHRRAASATRRSSSASRTAQKLLVCEHDGKEVRIEFDQLLCAVGRVANTAGYGLEELGIPVDAGAHRRDQRIPADALSRTSTPAATSPGPYQFTHTAAHQAWYAAVNALFGGVQAIPRRLLGDPVGDLHRSGGGARRPERDRGEGAGHRLRGHDLRHRRPGPRDRRRARRTAWSRCSPCRARTGSSARPSSASTPAT